MNKIDYNYHSHTYRCGHASGSDEEYILTAIDAGFKEYGVSDHVILPGIIHPNMRGRYEELDGYIKSINSLKEKYKDKINIHLGFEAEYMESCLDYYNRLLESHKIEYLILGQHCYYEGNRVMWYVAMEPHKGLEMYTEHVIKGIESGLFKYVAHPDLFCIFYDTWDEFAAECSKRIIEASIKYNVPLEINLCKVRAKHYGYIERDFPTIYPYLNFWKLVAKSKARVVVGVDSHCPSHNVDSYIEYVDDLVKETGLKIEYNYRLN